MKKFLITIFIALSFLMPWISQASSVNNVKTDIINNWTTNSNDILDKVWNDNNFFKAQTKWESWLKNLLLNLARDAKVLIYAIIILLWVIIVMKLIFSKWGDEDVKKLKKWALRWTIWIVVMQTSTVAYKLLFDKDVNSDLANKFNNDLVYPFINLLYLLAAFVFIFVAIVAFYKMVTANWNDDNIKKWKATIVQAIIWFIVIKFSSILVYNTFNPTCSNWNIITYWWSKVCENITDNAKILITIINWINGFLALVILLMIIYAWFLYITSWGADEKQKKAKNILIYVTIWLIILIASYLILTFFIYPNSYQKFN